MGTKTEGWVFSKDIGPEHRKQGASEWQDISYKLTQMDQRRNVKYKNIKFLEDNITENVDDSKFGNDF